MLYNVVDEGRVLDARVELTGSDIRLYSRSGRRNTPNARNSDYSLGLRSLLRQLKLNQLGLLGAYVDSKDVQSMPLPERQILRPAEASLSAEQQFTLLGQRMRRVGRTDDRPGGNNNKLIRLCVDAQPGILQRALHLEPAPALERNPRRSTPPIHPHHETSAEGVPAIAATKNRLPLFGPGEKGGTYTLAPMEAQPERLVRMLHGEVWLALAEHVGANKTELRKPRHLDGYEVDGFIETEAGEVLIEIKTDCQPADVYEGLGQLLLYGSMLQIRAARRILLMPGRPSAALVAAALDHGVEVHAYDLRQENGATRVEFETGFLAACGCASLPSD